MHLAQGKYFIDGYDLYTNFGIMVKKGSNAAFLKQPKKKDSLTHDWQDSNGLDVDLTKIFFEKRDISIPMAMVAATEADFWRQHIAFFSVMSQPGLRRLTVKELDRDFFVYYSDCTSFDKLRHLKAAGKLVFLFTLVISEPNPTIVSDMTYLVDEDRRFIVT